MADTKVELPCACCQKPTDQEVIPSVSAGQVYHACLRCGTVTHKPRQPEAAS